MPCSCQYAEPPDGSLCFIPCSVHLCRARGSLHSNSCICWRGRLCSPSRAVYPPCSVPASSCRAYDYEEDDGVKAACQAAWGTRAPMEEGDAIEDDAVEEAAVEEEGVEVDAVEDEVAEEEALQVDAVEEEGDSALQQAGEGQQQHKEGPPAVEAAAAVELSDREAEEREGPDGGATDAACAPAAAPPSATPKRKRQTLMTEAAASKVGKPGFGFEGAGRHPVLVQGPGRTSFGLPR